MLFGTFFGSKANRSRRGFAPGVDRCERICLLTAGVSLSGHVFVDVNANGTRDATEPGVSDAVVTLYDANLVNILGQAVTGPDGAYQFDDANNVDSGDLLAGSYLLYITPPPGATAANHTDPVDVVSATTTSADLDFAIAPTPAPAQGSSISGLVYSDLNGSGNWDAGDAPTVGEQVRLTGVDLAGSPVSAITFTAADGSFRFNGLWPGTYSITNLEANAAFAGDNVTGSVMGPGGTVPSGTISGFDSIAGIVLNEGESASGFQFGEVDTSIRGQAFADAQGDGLNPLTDTPMAGVKINLYRDMNENGKLDPSENAIVATTTTAPGTGAYRFLNTGHGYFIVRQVTPSGFVRTSPTFTDDNSVDVCECGISHNGVNFANYLKPTTGAIKNIRYSVIHPNGCSTTVTDLRGNVDPGDTVLVSFTVKPGQNPELSLVAYTAPASSFSASSASLQEVFRADTARFGPGTHTLSVLVPNSFYQVDFVAGPAIEHFGPSGSNIFYSQQGRLYSADNGGTRIAGASSISGYVYVDANRNGTRQSNEAGIAGVWIELTGVDYEGNWVSQLVSTGNDGSYHFTGLIGSNEDGYTIRELPAQEVLSLFGDGKDTVGSLGGLRGNDEFDDIVLNVNANGTGYNFGEIKLCYSPPCTA